MQVRLATISSPEVRQAMALYGFDSADEDYAISALKRKPDKVGGRE